MFPVPPKMAVVMAPKAVAFSQRAVCRVDDVIGYGRIGGLYLVGIGL